MAFNTQGVGKLYIIDEDGKYHPFSGISSVDVNDFADDIVVERRFNPNLEIKFTIKPKEIIDADYVILDDDEEESDE